MVEYFRPIIIPYFGNCPLTFELHLSLKKLAHLFLSVKHGYVRFNRQRLVAKISSGEYLTKSIEFPVAESFMPIMPS